MATYPTDASMTNRKPDRGFKISKISRNVNFTSKIGYEKRKQLSRRISRIFDFSYTSIDSTLKDNLEQFYNARGGTFETFTLNLSHFGLQGLINVKFNSDITIDHVISGNNADYYNVSLSLIEVP